MFTLLNQIYKCVGGGHGGVVEACDGVGWGATVRCGGGRGSCCWPMEVVHGGEGKC